MILAGYSTRQMIMGRSDGKALIITLGWITFASKFFSWAHNLAQVSLVSLMAGASANSIADLYISAELYSSYRSSQLTSTISIWSHRCEGRRQDGRWSSLGY